MLLVAIANNFYKGNALLYTHVVWFIDLSYYFLLFFFSRILTEIASFFVKGFVFLKKIQSFKRMRDVMHFGLFAL